MSLHAQPKLTGGVIGGILNLIIQKERGYFSGLQEWRSAGLLILK